MQSKHSPELVKKIHEMLQHNPQAVDHVVAYGQLMELGDDLVDEPKNIELIQEFTSLSSRVFSSDYWHQNKQVFLMIELLNNLTFFDTVKWEKSEEEWKRQDARCLNHCGYNMLFAVLIIECGFEATKKVSLEFRESAHRGQLDDKYEKPFNAEEYKKLPIIGVI